jgi:hypothetical protein
MKTGVAPTQVWRILHTGGFYLYHLQSVQHLLLEDHATYVQCCKWLQVHLHVLPDIIFMDEAQFTCDHITSTCYFYSWVHENSHEVAEHYFQYHFSVNVWCGILGNNFVGPHFIEGLLTAVYYRDFLQNNLPLYLEDVLLATRG